MATRVKLFITTLPADTNRHVIVGADGEQNLQPPANIKWTMVELRVGISAAGTWDAKYDTEKYYNGRQELDFLAKGRPHFMAIDIVKPHFIEFGATGDAGNEKVKIEAVVEESPVA